MALLRCLQALSLLTFSSACLAWSVSFALRPSDEAALEYRDMLEARQFARLDEIAAQQPGTATVADGTMRLDALKRGMFCHGTCRIPPTAEQYEHRKRLLDEWRESRPHSHLAIHLQVLGYLHQAWHARGTGFAHKVSEEGWRGFRENLDKAWRLHESQAAWGRKHPLWHETRLRLMTLRNASRETFEAAYLEAVRRFPVYLSLHFAGAEYYSARWHGSDAEMSAFIRRAVRLTEKQLGPTLYARINWAEERQDMFETGRADWQEVRQGFMRLVRDYPHEWNVNKFAAFACFNEDHALAAPLLQKLDGTPMADAWTIAPRLYQRCTEAVARLQQEDHVPLPF